MQLGPHDKNTGSYLQNWRSTCTCRGRFRTHMQARAQSLSWRLAGWEDATFPVPSDFTANCPLPQFRTRERVVHHTYTVNIFCPALRVTVGVHKRHTLWRALPLSFHAPSGAWRPLSGPRTYALALRALAAAYRKMAAECTKACSVPSLGSFIAMFRRPLLFSSSSRLVFSRTF